MRFHREFQFHSFIGALVLTLGIIAPDRSALGNVYATNIRLNDGTTNIATSVGDTITISYVLNEPASAGASVQFRSTDGAVRTLSLPAETQGALRGFNEITWDGKDASGQSMPSGTYSVTVTAAASGYTNWTQITSDTLDANTYVYDGRGIAVDRNPTSPYYGRIFVANGSVNPVGSGAGDNLGIIKLNADTSPAEEGISSAGFDGHTWTGAHLSPYKIEVSDDDFVYVDDLSNGGEVYRWDPTISSNSILAVLRTNNQPAGAQLSGPAIVGVGTNTQIWMADTNLARVVQWMVTAGGVCATNDQGLAVVTNSSTPGFSDVALDKLGNIYTCSFVTGAGDPTPRVFRYHAYNPSTNGGFPETNIDWAVGGGDDTYAGATGIAVDPTGRYVAVSFEGPDIFGPDGNTKILSATNGALVANLDLHVSMSGDANHDDTDCAWDAVGNVYYIDIYFGLWRAFSPPGTNQATTKATPIIQLTGGLVAPPSFTKVVISGANVVLTFSGSSNDSPSSFTLLSTSKVNGSYVAATNATITQVTPGVFQASVPASGPTQFYRIRK